MELVMHAFVFALFAVIQNARSGLDELDLIQLLDNLSDESSIDSSDEQGSKELAAYHKYLQKQDEKYYKQKLKKEISKEEKDEVKYFDDLLSKIKTINRNVDK